MRTPRLVGLLTLVIAVGLVPIVVTGGCRSGGLLRGSTAERGPVARAKGARAAPRPLCRPVRAIWVVRYHYRYAGDVRHIIDQCAAAGCNTVLWQVRGEATVDYPSRYEPWGREFDYRYPGFDPLGLAVAEAHKHGLRIEAWFNTMPGWHGTTPPPDGLGDHVYYAHPDWFLRDAAGRRQPLNKDYVILNPCLPEVRRHIASVVGEIAANYDVDGIHLDYVRYAWDGVRGARESYPRDDRTVELYRRDTGQRPDDDRNAWLHWRANQLTRLVSEIRAAVDRARPGATLTAAVWGDPSAGYWDYLQNGAGWVRAGLLDAVMPMAYTDNTAALQRDISAYYNLAGNARIVPGLGIYKQNEEQMRDQLACCIQWGGDFALFSYESLFPTAADRRSARPAEQQMRLQRQSALQSIR